MVKQCIELMQTRMIKGAIMLGNMYGERPVGIISWAANYLLLLVTVSFTLSAIWPEHNGHSYTYIQQDNLNQWRTLNWGVLASKDLTAS